MLSGSRSARARTERRARAGALAARNARAPDEARERKDRDEDATAVVKRVGERGGQRAREVGKGGSHRVTREANRRTIGLRRRGSRTRAWKAVRRRPSSDRASRPEPARTVHADGEGGHGAVAGSVGEPSGVVECDRRGATSPTTSERAFGRATELGCDFFGSHRRSFAPDSGTRIDRGPSGTSPPIKSVVRNRSRSKLKFFSQFFFTTKAIDRTKPKRTRANFFASAWAHDIPRVALLRASRLSARVSRASPPRVRRSPPAGS